MSEQVATVEAIADVVETSFGGVSGGVSGPAMTGGSPAEPETEVAVQDLLVEEVSIDGMCGVY